MVHAPYNTWGSKCTTKYIYSCYVYSISYTIIIMAPKIPTLDLFSGIAGFSYALKSVCRTVAYCEIDPFCKRVIQRNIERKLIDDAPIFDDVTKLHAKDLPSNIKMITAGWPCNDISCANRDAAGINGIKSKLFFHIPRIIKEIGTIDAVLLENSSCIVTRGLNIVLSQLRRLGFNVFWSIFTATEVNALHQRKRWFCLAIRPKSFILRITTFKNACSFSWRANSFKNNQIIIKPDDKHAIHQMRMRHRVLGMSVVPQVVWHAFYTLHKFAKSTSSRASIQNDNTNNIPIQKTIHASFVDNYSISKHKPDFRIRPPLNLKITDGKHTFLCKYYGTPVTSWKGLNKLSPYNANLMDIQLFRLNSTPSSFKTIRDTHIINVHWSEYILGYPRNFTNV